MHNKTPVIVDTAVDKRQGKKISKGDTEPKDCLRAMTVVGKI